MTTENHRFVRKMRDALRIRLVDDKNSKSYERFLKEGAKLTQGYGGAETISFGIENEGTPAGAMKLFISDGNVIVGSVYVDEEERLQGCGSSLLVRAKEYALERGLKVAACELPADQEELKPFFEKNGFYYDEDEEADGFAMIWEEEFETEVVTMEDRSDADRLAINLDPMTTIMVPKLMRIQEFLEEEGFDAEVITGEKNYVWADRGNYDIQISYLSDNGPLRDFYLIFSSFISIDDASEEELLLKCTEINKSAYFLTAIPDEGGVMLRYTLAEAVYPVTEEAFFTTLLAFDAEVKKAFLQQGI